MKIRHQAFLMILLAISLLSPTQAQQQARVEMFSPEGTVSSVRQARARFSEPMVPFGDPRLLPLPFEVDCAQQGTARWVDERNWVYDFDRDLPGGVRCEFRIRPDLRTLAGRPVGGQSRFAFSTGGPAILFSDPYEGTLIDEDQIFILTLNCPASEASALAGGYFAVEGIAGRVAARIVSGSLREEILKSRGRYRYRDTPPENLLLLQARQTFPSQSRISLVWGRGIASLSGIATEKDQVLPFITRQSFTAAFHCQRENLDADCIPFTPMRLSFPAPIKRSDAAAAFLRGPNGKVWRPRLPADEDQTPYVYSIDFPGPFPEQSTFSLAIPPGIRDDAGRPLVNAAKFPLTVKTGEYPPLAKFAADFGILELTENPLLPVTLRNVEPSIAARMLEVEGGEGFVEPRELNPEEKVESRISGKIFRVPSDKANQMLSWIKNIRRRGWEDRRKSVFGPVTKGKTRSFSVPKLQGPKPFEVVGIPIKDPGFYVVELESEILGARLLGESRPMYVPTTVLVTDLAVHFKRGIDSSLVWVTSLSRTQPVARAAVEARDCEGKMIWQGLTDQGGIARPGKLPADIDLPRCSWDPLEQGLVVTAQAGKDMAFAHSSWDDGIERWRFQVPMEWDRSLTKIHTIFDRTLLRAGETVHMKHIFRVF